MVFFKKWLRSHPQFLLHFLILIDVLMLCRKFELIPSSNKIFNYTVQACSVHVQIHVHYHVHVFVHALKIEY